MTKKTRYGTIEIVGIHGRQRKELYTRENGEKIAEYCHVVDYKDFSPRVNHDQTSENYRAYNENCSCCWLGFTHSVDLHDQEIKGA